MKDIINQIGNNIKQVRKKQGLTQTELAQKINVDPKYISRLETGNSTPSLPVVIKISEVLKTDISKFFTIDDINKKSNLIYKINAKLDRMNVNELNVISDITSYIIDE